MREYKGSEIRNIAVVGHGASGKTSLVDALAFVSGSSKRHGSVKDGTALTDTAAEEIERGFSINLGCAFAEWQENKVNLIDTPGYLDFQGDAIAGLSAADGALCVIPATAGVEVGTERMFREAVARRDPVLFVVTMMDKEHADFDSVYQQIKSRLTTKVIPVEVPVGQGASFHGIVNLFSKKAHVYKRGAKTGEYEETDIPAESKELFDKYYAELIESISATDDTLLEHYLEGGEISRDEAIAGMKEAMKRMELFPLFCVSSELNYGMQAVLSDHDRAHAQRVRDGRAARLHGCRGRRDGRDPRPGRCAGGRACVQDDVRAACRRGDVLPALRWHRHRMGTSSITRRAPASRSSTTSQFRRGKSASRCRVSTPATLGVSPRCAIRTRTTRSRRAQHPVRLAQISFPEGSPDGGARVNRDR